MNWQGAASEKDYPYSNSSSAPPVIARENAQDVAATVKDVYFIPTQGADVETEKTVIKNLISTYGSVMWGYYHDDTYYNASTGAYNCTFCVQFLL